MSALRAFDQLSAGATVEGMAFTLGRAFATTECSEGGKLLALARVSLEAALALGRQGVEPGREWEVHRAQMAFQSAAHALDAELKAQRRAA